MKNVYTVGQVNAYIKNMFAQDYMLRSIIVSGEASNVKYHSSGHVYFTLKDNKGALSCVMYASYVKSLKFRLTEGSQIEVTGSVSVYERAGSYQLCATTISLAGAGALYEKYEKLKASLEEEGLFAEIYKRPIPKYAKRIGIVTASTGAAIQDIIQISARRNPYVQLILYPAQVQGDGAKESIVAGIQSFQNMDVDVIIVGRGGGSIEDLWAFNEECVARAIFDSRIPIVSAVGHESDFTIADYVADLRASTPSAAAELTVFSYEVFNNRLTEISNLMNYHMKSRLNKENSYVNQLQARLESLSPQAQIKLKRLAYMNMLRQLDSLMENKVSLRKHKLMLYIEKMKGLSPLERMSSGYASVTNAEGSKVTGVEGLNAGDFIRLTMRNGIIDANVTGTTIYNEEDFIRYGEE